MGTETDDVPESVESHCLPYNKSLYTYLQCTLRGLAWAGSGGAVCAPVDRSNVVTFRTLALQIDSLVFVSCCM